MKTAMHMHEGRLAPFFESLKSLFQDMDLAYDNLAREAGFQCNGCSDNCCRTHFHHHTFIEFFYIHLGLGRLDPDIRAAVFKTARDVRGKAEADLRQGKTVRIMCPLNVDGLCAVYPFRPMICRMHGIPHQLTPPGGQTTLGPGCEQFYSRCGTGSGSPFDRTPFYIGLAKLEKQFKDTLGLPLKIKKTIYQMLTDSHEIDRYLQAR